MENMPTGLSNFKESPITTAASPTAFLWHLSYVTGMEKSTHSYNFSNNLVSFRLEPYNYFIVKNITLKQIITELLFQKHR